MVLDAALVGTGCYIAAQEGIRPSLMSLYGTDNCGGTPCWRAALVLLPQLAILPVATAIAAREHKSLRQWCTDCETNGLRTAARVSVFVFYAFLLVDLLYAYFIRQTYADGTPVVVLRKLMIDHHVVCLLGHLYATSLCPKVSRPCFVFAITCLEFGSGMSNVFWLLKPTAHAGLGALAYLVGMTISNVTTTILTWFWNVRAREGGAHLLRRWPPMCVWFFLIYLRQKEVHKISGYHWPWSF